MGLGELLDVAFAKREAFDDGASDRVRERGEDRVELRFLTLNEDGCRALREARGAETRLQPTAFASFENALSPFVLTAVTL